MFGQASLLPGSSQSTATGAPAVATPSATDPGERSPLNADERMFCYDDGRCTGGYELVVDVLTGLLGRPLPTAWTLSETVLKGTGRAPFTAADRAVLGPDAARLPLFG